ncbi:hypothetical protein LINPERHAP1_LOCUS33184, partial [Linum perenne]
LRLRDGSLLTRTGRSSRISTRLRQVAYLEITQGATLLASRVTLGTVPLCGQSSRRILLDLGLLGAWL